MTETAVKVGKHGRNAGWWRVRDAIAAGQTFTNSSRSFRGGPNTRTYPYATSGQLPPRLRESLVGARYIVWSYETPIAWQTGDGEWVTPAVHYSRTTSVHQATTVTAVSQLQAPRER